MANHVHAHRYVIFYLLSVFPSHLRLLNGQAKVALYTVIMLQPCCVVCGEVPTGHTYIQTIGTRHVNSTYSKRITPTSLLVGSPHNAEHFTSISGAVFSYISAASVAVFIYPVPYLYIPSSIYITSLAVFTYP